MPSQIDELSPGEVSALAQAERRRFNRTIRTIAWALSWIPLLVYKGAAVAINHSKGGNAELGEIDELKIAMTAPHFDREQEPPRHG